jgi:hypothetical protein
MMQYAPYAIVTYRLIYILAIVHQRRGRNRHGGGHCIH